MTTGTLKIHSENILPIIKQWLYSDKDIFVRELVSNACDACAKIRLIKNVPMDELSIHIDIDKEAKTLTFTDTGIGMTAEEVEKYIAQIAFSGAEEFVEKYKKSDGEDPVIGHFGLGFFSAYMVASSVEIDTRSYMQKEKPALWTCDGSSSYTLDRGTRKKRGTQIRLHINEESLEYLEEGRLRAILKKHCAFLPYALFLGDEQINAKEPLWLKAPKECTDEEYLSFYSELYPGEADPLFWIHLNVDFPFHLKGILYFPKIRRHFDTSKNTIKLFCNRVFVSDNCKDLIPDFLMVLQGAIDSPDIPLNVSRSTLQMDSTVRQLATHISKKVSDKLKELHNDAFEAYCNKWPHFEVILKMGAMQDRKFFDRTLDLLIWKNTSGAWRHLSEYLEEHESAYEGRVYYTTDEKNAPACLKMYKEQGIEVLFTHPLIDGHFIPHLENKLKEKHPRLKFCRIDGVMPDVLIDKKREKTVLDADGKTAASVLTSLVKKYLVIDDLAVEAKSLSHDALFGFVAFDEDSRRMRDMMQMYSEEGAPSMPCKKTFVINTNSALAEALPKMEMSDPELCSELVHEMYELSLLSQREMAPEALPVFLERTQKVLSALCCKTL